MILLDNAIEGYLLMSCSDTYFTPEVIAGFAKNAVFQEKTPFVEYRSGDLKERDNLLAELKESFSLKKIEPILEKLVQGGSLEKDVQQVRKGKKRVYQIVYRLPANKKVLDYTI